MGEKEGVGGRNGVEMEWGTYCKGAGGCVVGCAELWEISASAAAAGRKIREREVRILNVTN